MEVSAFRPMTSTLGRRCCVGAVGVAAAAAAIARGRLFILRRRGLVLVLPPSLVLRLRGGQEEEDDVFKEMEEEDRRGQASTNPATSASPKVGEFHSRSDPSRQGRGGSRGMNRDEEDPVLTDPRLARLLGTGKARRKAREEVRLVDFSKPLTRNGRFEIGSVVQIHCSQEEDDDEEPPEYQHLDGEFAFVEVLEPDLEHYQLRLPQKGGEIVKVHERDLRAPKTDDVGESAGHEYYWQYYDEEGKEHQVRADPNDPSFLEYQGMQAAGEDDSRHSNGKTHEPPSEDGASKGDGSDTEGRGDEEVISGHAGVEHSTENDNLACPITGEVLVDPVIDPTTGRSFERQAILEWLEQHGTSPLSRKPLHPKDLIPNTKLRKAIKEAQQQYGSEDVAQLHKLNATTAKQRLHKLMGNSSAFVEMGNDANNINEKNDLDELVKVGTPESIIANILSKRTVPDNGEEVQEPMQPAASTKKRKRETKTNPWGPSWLNDPDQSEAISKMKPEDLIRLFTRENIQMKDPGASPATIKESDTEVFSVQSQKAKTSPDLGRQLGHRPPGVVFRSKELRNEGKRTAVASNKLQDINGIKLFLPPKTGFVDKDPQLARAVQLGTNEFELQPRKSEEQDPMHPNSWGQGYIPTGGAFNELRENAHLGTKTFVRLSDMSPEGLSKQRRQQMILSKIQQTDVNAPTEAIKSAAERLMALSSRNEKRGMMTNQRDESRDARPEKLPPPSRPPPRNKASMYNSLVMKAMLPEQNAGEEERIDSSHERNQKKENDQEESSDDMLASLV